MHLAPSHPDQLLRLSNLGIVPGTVLVEASLRSTGEAVYLTLDGQIVSLTALEYRTLHYLMRHKGAVVSKTELTEHIYKQDFDLDSNVIEVLINRLRTKLCHDLIETRRGLGYQILATERPA